MKYMLCPTKENHGVTNKKTWKGITKKQQNKVKTAKKSLVKDDPYEEELAKMNDWQCYLERFLTFYYLVCPMSTFYQFYT